MKTLTLRTRQSVCKKGHHLPLSIAAFLFFTSSTLKAEIWSGLEDSISYSALNSSWIEFDHSKDLSAPLATQIEFNGKKIPPMDQSKISEIFEERTFAWFKNPNDKIKITNDSEKREVWNFPVGTFVAHLILLKTNTSQNESRIFEIRLIEKLGDKSWAFGSYYPKAFGDTQLHLQKESGLKPFVVNYQNHRGQPVNLNLKRISVTACQNCHFMTSPSSYQYSNAETMGPCGFGPGSQEFKSSWIQRFQSKYGQSPF